MKGALLGLLITLLGIPARVLVAWHALRQRGYPWWMLTPDDPVSPFGQYEATVRRVYGRWGRRIGDLYWLGLRNVMYGLRYRLKPVALYPRMGATGALNYAHLHPYARRFVRGRVTEYRIGSYKMWTIRLPFGMGIKAGWKVDRMIDDPFTPRQPINMDGRPMFSLRRLG